MERDKIGAIDRYSRAKEENGWKKKKKKEKDTKPLCSQICFLIFLLSSQCSSPVYMEGETRGEEKGQRQYWPRRRVNKTFMYKTCRVARILRILAEEDSRYNIFSI